MSEPRIVVTIPTVTERARFLDETVAMWHAIGYQPLIEMTPPDRPRSPATHALMLRQCLQAAMMVDRSAVAIFCEDDVLLSSRLRGILPALAAGKEPITLYLPGRQFYPRRLMVPLHGAFLAPIIGQASWFGSQCVLLPPAVVAEVLAAEVSVAALAEGGDMVLRTAFAAHGRRLLTTVPNLVQHRAPPSVTSKRYRSHQSWCYAP